MFLRQDLKIFLSKNIQKIFELEKLILNNFWIKKFKEFHFGILKFKILIKFGSKNQITGIQSFCKDRFWTKSGDLKQCEYLRRKMVHQPLLKVELCSSSRRMLASSFAREK